MHLKQVQPTQGVDKGGLIWKLKKNLFTSSCLSHRCFLIVFLHWGAATAISKFECLVNFTEFKLSTSLTVEYSFRPNFPIPKIKIIFAASGHYLNLHDIMTNQPKWKHFLLASKKVQKEYRIWKESLSLESKWMLDDDDNKLNIIITNVLT